MNKSSTEQLISCPICNKKVSYSLINNHLDECTGETPKCSKNQPTLNRLLGGKRKQQQQPMVVDLENEEKEVKEKDVVSAEPPEKKQKLNTHEHEARQLQKVMHLPLSEKLRPKDLGEYVGQSHILSSENGVLYKYIKQGTIPSMVLWGPPGVGKTSLARLLTKTVNQERATKISYILLETSATKANTQELRKIFENSKKEFALTKRLTVLFIDEIHRFNKSQQDLLLPHVEAGDVVLIGATTENPSFQLNNALISRCQVFVLEKLGIDEMCRVITRGIAMLNKYRNLVWHITNPLKLSREVQEYIVDISMGDTRRALNLLEMVEVSTREKSEELNTDDVREIINSKATELRTYYDAKGDNHYDTISAFHKSIRGSDENASLYYLARMLQGGEDPLYIARRMIRIASEDVGMVDNSLLPLSVATYNAVTKVGLPEADLALAQCCVALARAPKSVELYRAWKQVNALLRENKHSLASSEIPMHLRNAPTKLMEELGYHKGYKYNPDYAEGEVDQEYFPDEVLEKCNKEELKFMNGRHLGDVRDPDLGKKDQR